MSQLDYYTSKFEKRKFPITIVCDNVTNAPNIGSLFRTADAFGVDELILCGDNIPLGRKMTKTSRATENIVDFKITESAFDTVSEFKEKGYQVVALEITSNSQSLHTVEFPKTEPIVLVVGDENFGVSEAILDAVDMIVHIDMFGNNSSMNVVQATSIALFEITRQRL